MPIKLRSNVWHAVFVATLVTCIYLIPAPIAHASASHSVFGDRSADMMGGASILPKWVRVVTRASSGRLQIDECPLGSITLCQAESWHEFERNAKGLDRLALLDAVNDFVNRVAYRRDDDNYGLPDYWASPAEFFEKGGDCEDYVIAKYFILKHFGIAPSNMRMVVVIDNDIVHAILVVSINADEVILDNRFSLSDSLASMARYRVIYSFDENFAWVHPNGVLRLNLPRPAAAKAVKRPDPTPKVSTKLPPSLSTPSERTPSNVWDPDYRVSEF